MGILLQLILIVCTIVAILSLIKYRKRKQEEAKIGDTPFQQMDGLSEHQKQTISSFLAFLDDLLYEESVDAQQAPHPDYRITQALVNFPDLSEEQAQAGIEIILKHRDKLGGESVEKALALAGIKGSLSQDIRGSAFPVGSYTEPPAREKARTDQEIESHEQLGSERGVHQFSNARQGTLVSVTGSTKRAKVRASVSQVIPRISDTKPASDADDEESEISPYLADASVTGKKPEWFQIGDSPVYDIIDWKEIMVKGTDYLMAQHEDKFHIFAPHLHKTKYNLHRAKQLSNGTYLETNFNAEGVLRFVRNLLESLGRSPEELRFGIKGEKSDRRNDSGTGEC